MTIDCRFVLLILTMSFVLSACERGYPQDLRRLSAAKHAAFNDIVLRGSLRPLGMPQWDDVFTEEDVEAIHAYIISMSWNAYNEERELSQ